MHARGNNGSSNLYVSALSAIVHEEVRLDFGLDEEPGSGDPSDALEKAFHLEIVLAVHRSADENARLKE